MRKIEFKGQTAETINLLFQSLLVTYLVLLLIEQIWTGSVSYYLNLNYLLIFVIIFGIFDVFSEHEEKKPEKIKKRDYLFIGILGILGFVIIKFKTADLGWLSWLISVVAGVLIVLLSILVLEDDEEKKEKRHKTEKSVNVKTNWAVGIIITILSLALISLALTIFTSLGLLESLRIVFGSVYVLFFPGFLISYIFFPKTKEFDSDEEEGEEREKGAIDWIERVALSFALSIAIVPLAVFYLNLVGVRINLLNSFLTILGIILIAGIILAYKLSRKNEINLIVKKILRDMHQ